MSSTFKCMSVNPVDKCMWMKIGVYIGVEYGKKYPSDQSAYNKSILWYNKERSIILYATDKRIFFFTDKLEKYFTHNIYRNSSNMGRKILIVFKKKKKGINTMCSSLYTKQTIFSHFYTHFQNTETIYIINKLHQSYGQYSC